MVKGSNCGDSLSGTTQSMAGGGTRLTKKTDLKKQQPQGPVCKWISLPPPWCSSCEQDTHMIDRDSGDKPTYLVWCKPFFSRRLGHAVLTGEECYKCMDTGRRYFKDYGSQKELNDATKDDRSIDDAFHEKRAGRVQGTDKYMMTGNSDVTETIKKQDKVFADEFEEGTFTPLVTWARLRNIRYIDEEDLLQHVRENFAELKLEQDDRGTWGIATLDHAQGACRFRRGKSTAVAQTRASSADTGDLRADRFEGLAAKFEDKRGFTNVHSAVSLKTAALEQEPRHALGPDDDCDMDDRSSVLSGSATRCSPIPQSQYRMPAALESSGTAPAHRPPPISLDGPQNKASPSFHSRQLSHDGAARANHPPALGSSVSEAAPEENKKKRKTAAALATETAEKLVLKTSTDFTWMNQWSSKTRRREFENLISRLGVAGRKCASNVTEPHATTIGQQCFDLAEKFSNREAAFEAIRNDFRTYALTELTPIDRQIWQEGDVSQLSQIFSAAIHNVVEDIGKEKTILIFSSFVDCSGSMEHLSFSYIQDIDVRKAAQRNVVLSLTERLFKHRDKDYIIKAGRDLDACFVSLDRVEGRDISLGLSSTTGGFYPQPLFDLHTIRVLASKSSSGLLIWSSTVWMSCHKVLLSCGSTARSKFDLFCASWTKVSQPTFACCTAEPHTNLNKLFKCDEIR